MTLVCISSFAGSYPDRFLRICGGSEVDCGFFLGFGLRFKIFWGGLVGSYGGGGGLHIEWGQ